MQPPIDQFDRWLVVTESKYPLAFGRSSGRVKKEAISVSFGRKGAMMAPDTIITLYYTPQEVLELERDPLGVCSERAASDAWQGSIKGVRKIFLSWNCS